MKSQKEATFAAIVAVCANHGYTVTPTESVAEFMTKERRSEVNDILCQGFKEGHIQLDRTYDTDEAMRSYVSGLISNWIRKDSRLNGGGKYVPKNPGTRTGSSDPQLKSLRALLSNVTTDDERVEIQSYIDARLAEIAKEKAPKVDLSALPEALRSKYSA